MRCKNAFKSLNRNELPIAMVCAVSPAQKRPCGFRHKRRKTKRVISERCEIELSDGRYASIKRLSCASSTYLTNGVSIIVVGKEIIHQQSIDRLRKHFVLTQSINERVCSKMIVKQSSSMEILLTDRLCHSPLVDSSSSCRPRTGRKPLCAISRRLPAF